ncbi:hypothetical protein C2G38_2075945, partial [Gigaspora rosea]
SHEEFYFASILLALLLTVNAAPFQLNKRAITFGPCSSEDPVDLIYVKIGTDPPESGEKESFDAGNPFNISVSNVPTPKLPDSYSFGVVVGEDTTPFGCAVANVGNSSEKSKILDFYKLI